MLTLNVRGKARKEFRAELSAPARRELRRQLGRALRAAGHAGALLCLSLTDDEELRALNRAYAGTDRPTDVLSFSQREGMPAGPVGRGHTPELLGDVVISVETALRQAQAAGHDLLPELLHLSVHGLCHLLGYDHATRAEERAMFGYEALLREQARARGRVSPVTSRHRPPVK